MSKSCVFAFSLGVVVGSFATWRYVKAKYERIAQEEIDSVTERFSKMEPAKKQEEPVNKVEDISEYKAKIEKQGYTYYQNHIEEKEGVTPVANSEKPYVITPDEFGEKWGYEVSTLTYYSDGVLTDEWDDPIQCVDEVVGLESLNHFGENKDDEDSVYVRNDTFKIDYEILRDERPYSNVVGNE